MLATKTGICVAAVTWILVAALRAQQSSAPARAPIDVSELGPQVGERVPDFSLRDQNWKIWTLQSIMGPKGAMLVFYRSADWRCGCTWPCLATAGRFNGSWC